MGQELVFDEVANLQEIITLWQAKVNKIFTYD